MGNYELWIPRVTKLKVGTIWLAVAHKYFVFTLYCTYNHMLAHIDKQYN